MARSPEYWARWDHYQKYGYFPKKSSPLSKAQDAVKEAPKEEMTQEPLFKDEAPEAEKSTQAKKNKLLEWEHFAYLPEETKRRAQGDD